MQQLLIVFYPALKTSVLLGGGGGGFRLVVSRQNGTLYYKIFKFVLAMLVDRKM